MHLDVCHKLKFYVSVFRLVVQSPLSHSGIMKWIEAKAVMIEVSFHGVTLIWSKLDDDDQHIALRASANGKRMEGGQLAQLYNDVMDSAKIK